MLRLAVCISATRRAAVDLLGDVIAALNWPRSWLAQPELAGSFQQLISY
jgi:hypothetical protein